MSDVDELNEQEVREAQAKAKVAKAKAEEEAAKQKIRDQKQKNREKRVSSFLKLPKFVKIIASVCVLVVVFLCAAILPGILSTNKGVTISEASLKEAVDISKLSTAEFSYNGIAEKKRNDSDTDYYIYYEATANAGIDMKQIGFSIDEGQKTITVTIPEIQIDSPVIDESTMDYLPRNANVNLKEALDICKQDAQTEISQSSNIRKTAEENLKTTLEALLLPIVGNEGYALNWKDDSSDVETGDENDDK